MSIIPIILLCVLAALIYGLTLGQIESRLCLEYFTIAHPAIPHFDTPAAAVLFWSIVPFVCLGLLIGLLFAAGATAGPTRRLHAYALLRPMTDVFLTAGIIAVFAGRIGYLLCARGVLIPHGNAAYAISASKHPAFYACICADVASLLLLLCGAGYVGLGLLAKRRDPANTVL